MGGCCCCASSGSDPDRVPVYLYHPPTLEEREPLSSNFGGSSPGSAIVIIETTFDASTPDTYRAPPAPLPYDVPSDDCHDMEKSDTKDKADNDNISVKLEEDQEIKKSAVCITSEEEDVCPICLEEFYEENPRNFTKCAHHFHLSCILEWMERSDTCPVCDQVTLVDEMYE